MPQGPKNEGTKYNLMPEERSQIYVYIFLRSLRAFNHLHNFIMSIKTGFNIVLAAFS